MVSTHLKNISQKWGSSPNGDENKTCLKPAPRKMMWRFNRTFKVCLFALEKNEGSQTTRILFMYVRIRSNKRFKLFTVYVTSSHGESDANLRISRLGFFGRQSNEIPNLVFFESWCIRDWNLRRELILSDMFLQENFGNHGFQVPGVYGFFWHWKNIWYSSSRRGNSYVLRTLNSGGLQGGPLHQL